MLIEILGIGFKNKGSELMMHAIIEKLTNEIPDVSFTVAPTDDLPYIKRAHLGLYQKLWLHKYKVQWGAFDYLIPKGIRKLYGLVTNKEIDAILDSSGYRYYQYWKDASALYLQKYFKNAKKKGKKIIFLPQAFGPFVRRTIINSFKVIAENANLIYARDPISYKYIVEITGEMPHVKIAPDFTNLISGSIPLYYRPQELSVCIIPNSQMIKKTEKGTAIRYKNLLRNTILHLFDSGVRPFFLIHEEKNDLSLAEEINTMIGSGIEIIQESNPIFIKGIVGSSYAVISSRFHGLVNSLSQNIPCISTSWSHKYEMLLEQFGCGECLLQIGENLNPAVANKIDLILNNEKRKNIINRLESSNLKLRLETEKMWEEVIKVLNS